MSFAISRGRPESAIMPSMFLNVYFVPEIAFTTDFVSSSDPYASQVIAGRVAESVPPLDILGSACFVAIALVFASISFSAALNLPNPKESNLFSK